MSTSMVFGRGFVGVRNVPITEKVGCIELSFLQTKHEVGKPHEEENIPEVSLIFENVQGLDALLFQLNNVRSDMLNTLPPHLRMGA